VRIRVAVVALAVAATASAAAPPAGRLDASFGGDGLVVERLTDGHDLAKGVAALPDGSVVVAAESGGHVQPFLGPDAVLLRLRRNGARDRTFGRDGTLRVSIGRGDDSVSGVVRLADGRLVAGGAAGNLNGDAYGDDAALFAFRARPSGRLDRTFSGDGVASVRVPTRNFVTPLAGIAVAPDGSVVVAGTTENKRLTLARFDARGRLDRSFGTRGLAFHRVQYPDAIARQPDGRLLVVGMTDLPKRDWFVLRLRPDGSRDRTFGGGDGLVVTSFGDTPDSAHAVAVDARRRIVVAGLTYVSDVNCSRLCTPLRLVRYLPNGRVDASFGSDGRVAPELGLAHDTLGLALQRDGGILVAGSSYVPDFLDRQLAVWRFDEQGRLDSRFGTAGAVVANPTHERVNLDFLTSIALGPDGKIVAAGGASKPTTGFDSRIMYDVAVLRAR
jgi:uncharacterized delta-60 repeat protein